MTDSRSMAVDSDSIKQVMIQTAIPDTSIAFLERGVISSKHISSKHSTKVADDSTMYGAASLSKPVFAYLVLKLVSQNKLSIETKLKDILPFTDFCKQNGFSFDSTVTDSLLDNVTVGMMLSHTSGLNLPNGKPIESQFTPGTEYSYSNLGLYYLQKVVEQKMGYDLQRLAHEYIFGPDALKMKNTCYYRDYELCKLSEPDRKPNKIYISSGIDGLSYEVIGLNGELKKGMISWDKLPDKFPANLNEIINPANKCITEILNHTAVSGYTTLKSAVAVNSLFTTPRDYLIFVDTWLNDKDPIMQSAFRPVIFMDTDDLAKKLKIDPEDLSKVAWGLGWGLQADKPHGSRSTHAYHTADMNMWRAQVAIDLHNKRAVVYFTNSKNGHILADQIITPNIELRHAHNYFFQKYGFARQIEANWEAKENARMEYIDAIVNSRNMVRSKVESLDRSSMTDDFSQRPGPVINKPLDMPSSDTTVKSRVAKIEADQAQPIQAQHHKLSSTARLHERISTDKNSLAVTESKPESNVGSESSGKRSMVTNIEANDMRGINNPKQTEKKEVTRKPLTPFDSMRTGPTPFKDKK